MSSLMSIKSHQLKVQKGATKVQVEVFSSAALHQVTAPSNGGRKLLGSSSNKANLVRFLVEEWKQAKHREKLQNKVLYVTCDDLCYKLTTEHCEAVGELQSTHGEADTPMLLHALHAARAGYKAVVITAEDIDVLALCLAFNNDIPCSLYQKSGTRNPIQFQNISRLARALGDNVCSLHCSSWASFVHWM